MSEQRATYQASVPLISAMGAEIKGKNDSHLNNAANPVIVNYERHSGATDTELETVRSKLVDIECQLISLLVTVQRALGKEPSVMTRAERRSR